MYIDKITLTIPFLPISVNVAFAGKTRRYKSNEYVEFENKMQKYFLELGEKLEIEGDNWLSVQYRFYFKIYNKNGSKKVKDTFNFEKALTDCLSKHIKGFEDHKIKGGSCWKYDSEKEYIEVEIKELI